MAVIPNLTVPTLTRHDLLGRLLGTVDVEVGHLLIVDNSGVGFEVPDGPWGRATVLRMPGNLGVAGSWNLAIRTFWADDLVFVCADDVTLPPGSLSGLATIASAETLTLSGTWPYWCLFAVGQRFVEKVGLFDERFYPAYYEDKEMEWRAGRLGGRIVTSTVQVGHDNASTLHTPGRNWQARKAVSEDANGRLLDDKKAGEDSGPSWSAYRWRAQSWS
jgi:GT2 family glycosyltransferase